MNAPLGRPARGNRWRPIVLVAGAVAATAGLYAGVRHGVLPNPLGDDPPAAKAAGGGAAPGDAAVVTAKTIRPKREASVPVTVEQLANVEAYYRADLRARASGTVRRVHRDLGDKVRKGDVLVEIDVPEADQDVAKADAVIRQREKELKVSRAKLKDAKAAVDVAAATIRQRQADVQGATATRDLRKGRFERFAALEKRGTVVGSAVYEEERDFLAAESALTAAKANVDRARADYSESESKVEGAEADIELKSALIDVARTDLERAKAVAGFARVVAPFDGVVVRRTVDPGSFVQNATTGVSEPLIAVAREDIVTVTARFPDSVAPLVRRNSPAVVRIDDLPGVSIAAAVTRFAPAVDTSDRTVRVEIDLFNGDPAEFRRLQDAIKAGGAERTTKGPDDPLPVRAFGDTADTRRLMPGMTGTVRLSVGGFGESFVLPSTAVYSRGGATFLMVVENGKTRQVPVRVQVNDGRTVRVAVVSVRKMPDGGTREVLSELTGTEDVVVSRQLEFGDGATVKPGPSEW